MKLGFTRAFLQNDVAQFLGVVIVTFFGPWWGFVVITWIGAYDRARKGASAVLPPALVSSFAWFVIAFVRDAMNGFRISKRIGGFFKLPHGSLLYVILLAVAVLLAALAAASGAQLGRFNRSKTAR